MVNEITAHRVTEIKIVRSKDRLSEQEPYYSVDKIFITDEHGEVFTVTAFGSLTNGFTNIKLEDNSRE